MKKKFAFVVCLALIVTMGMNLYTASSASGLEGQSIFEHYKYMNVYDDGTVRPDQGITRGELANAVFNLLDADDKKVFIMTGTPFKDVPTNYIYAKQIAYLTSKGHFTGYEDGTFRPEETLTRAEFAMIIKRFKRLIELTNIVKALDIEGHWAAGAIKAVIVKGYMKGYTDGTFGPDNDLTRAEVATTLNRIFERKPDFKSVLKNNPNSTTDVIDLVKQGIINPVDITQKFSDLPMKHWAFGDMMEACISHRSIWDRLDDREIWIKFIDSLTYLPD